MAAPPQPQAPAPQAATSSAPPATKPSATHSLSSLCASAMAAPPTPGPLTPGAPTPATAARPGSSSSMHLATARKWLAQFPPVEWALGQLRQVLIGALRQGAVPEHVAFVMDGNRRFARAQRIETVEGHHLGFEALARILEVCYKTGVRVVTIYAFSIENFQRPKHEVEGLMALAKLKLAQLAQHGDLLSQYGARIRVLGQRDLIRPDVLEVVERVEAMTRDNGDAVLNVCFPYTSRDEIATAVKSVVQEWSRPVVNKERPFSATHISHSIIRSRNLSIGSASEAAQIRDQPGAPPTNAPSTSLQPPLPSHHNSSSPTASTATSDSESRSSRSSSHSGASSASTLHAASSAAKPSAATASAAPNTYPDPELIDIAALNAFMHTHNMPPLDLLVRTSGVARFSDFMLWQAHQHTEVVFAKVLWPQFDLWHFLPILVEWQWRRRLEARERERGVRGVNRAKAAKMA